MMPSEDRRVLEERIRDCWHRGEMNQAADVAIRGYGPELLGWLRGMTGDRQAAAEVFSIVCENVWRGLSGFRWDSSFRTWAYRLARSAWSRYTRSPAMSKSVEISDSIADVIAQPARSETSPWMRTEVKNKFTRLRQRLRPQDQMILTLRVSRQMTWEAIVQILQEDGHMLSKEDIQQRAVVLRQQFQRIKLRLRSLAIEEGLVETPVES